MRQGGVGEVCWERGLADWHLVIKLPEYAARRQVGGLGVQLPLLELE
jgi:hypothetical protein